jgi:hypothetical protein
MNYIYAIQLLLRKRDDSHGFITLSLRGFIFITFIVILKYFIFNLLNWWRVEGNAIFPFTHRSKERSEPQA